MPWAIRRGIVRRLREANGWTLDQASAKLGVSARQLRAYESLHPPRTIQLGTLSSLARGFGTQKTDIADWYDLGSRHLLVPLPAPAPSASTPVLPPVSTLSTRALRERQLGMDALMVRTSQGRLPLLGLSHFKLVWSRPLKYADQRFVVVGSVDDHQGLSLPVRKQLNARDGGKYRVVRWLEPDTVFYTTVFAVTSRDADALTLAAQENHAVGLVVYVAHRPPADAWRGFSFYGSDKAPFEFAFVCEQILPELPEIPHPSTAGRRK